jgi:uncharacterized RDD family membrane protein YckC
MQQELTQPQTTQPDSPVPSVSAVPVPTLHEYAGFWIRFLALIIDGFILGAVGTVINLIFAPIFGLGTMSVFSDPNPDPAQVDAAAASFFGAFMLLWLIQMAINLGYYVIMTSKYGATLGKKALGLRVIDDSDSNPSVGKAVMREVIGKWVSGLIFGIGYLMVAFDEKKQGLHDKIAGTFVVKN